MTPPTLKNTVYSWQGITAHGQSTSGEICALSLNLAKINLAKKGLQITAIRKKHQRIFSHIQTLTPEHIVLLLRQLATLMIAGIPLTDALHILSKNTEQMELSLMLTTLKNDLTAGNGLASSLQKFPRLFDNMTCSLIYAGEKTGTLDRMLERIAQHKEKLFILRSKIKQALFYPVIITLTAVIVTIVMLTFVVPRFADLFQSMHSTLPLFTLIIIQLAKFIFARFKLKAQISPEVD